MKVVIIGGVAAGPKAASRILRLCPEAEVTVIEKGEFLSYAGCGLPYYISGAVKEQSELMETPVGTVRDSAFFRKVKNVHVLNYTEALDIDRNAKTVRIRNRDGKEQVLEYDKLILATGADPVKPNFPGKNLKNIYSLKGVEDAEGIRSTLQDHKARNAVIVGGGLIGIEMAESLIETGCRVTIVELLPQILTILDFEQARIVEKYCESRGIKIMTGTKVLGFDGDESVTTVRTDNGDILAELVVLSVGVRPCVGLAQGCGLDIGETGAIAVNEFMMTSDTNIYAAGDCAEKMNLITGKPCFIPLGSTANKEGRVAANHICNIVDPFPGVIGSTICRIFDFSVGRTGLGEQEAIDAGFDPVISLSSAPDRAHFMPDANPLFLKVIADRKTRKLLGVQGTGLGVIDKRIDVAATAITAGMTIDQVAQLDLSYAPPFSSAIDILITAANIIRNKMDGYMKGITPTAVKKRIEAGEVFTFLDLRGAEEVEKLSIEGAVNIPLGQLRTRLDELDRDKPIVAFCKVSLRGYEAAIILDHNGFQDVVVMDGGIQMWMNL